MSSKPAHCWGDAELSPTGTGEHSAPITPQKYSARTLLREAATHRPLQEVAALVELLKRSGDVPNPGDEALRIAVISRPVSEVAALFDMLRATPHTAESSNDALRAVATDRSIEEVAQLIELFDRTKARGGYPMTDHFPPGPDGPGGPGRGGPGGHEEPEPTASVHVPDGPGGPSGPGGPFAPEPTASMHVLGPNVRPLRRGDQPLAPSRREHSLNHQPPRPPWAQRTAGMPQGGPKSTPAQTLRQPDYTAPGPLRSVLRWPTAAALTLCGLGHLPVNASHLPGAPAVAGLSMAITVIYLMLAGLLAMRDTAQIWTASAAGPMIIIALHALSRTGAFAPLGSGLGDTGMWPERLAVTLAIISTGLAGTALLTRPRHTGQTTTDAVTAHDATTATGAGRDPDQGPGPHPWQPAPAELRPWSTSFRTTGHNPADPGIGRALRPSRG
ncbi:hypothetical protein AB0G85_37400 [Streptomyces sioyaensis]|uniref:hypothetical protein n=1 Tax=Streptomyces sioyaensis TaxID=67364 RepID=UPI0033DBD324